MATPKGGYYNEAGKRVPSVTTIIGRFKDSSGLIKWAYKQGREHEHARHTGGEDPGDLYAVTRKAAEAGSIAHDLIEQHVLTGKLQTQVLPEWNEAPADVLARAWNSYEQFQQWWGNTRLEVIDTETGGVSEQYQFGGTYDALARDSLGRVVLVDWKTSNRVYSDYLVQLAAYAQIIKETRNLVVEGAHLLRVSREEADFAHFYWGDMSDGWEAFEHMRALYDIVKRLEKRV